MRTSRLMARQLIEYHIRLAAAASQEERDRIAQEIRELRSRLRPPAAGPIHPRVLMRDRERRLRPRKWEAPCNP